MNHHHKPNLLQTYHELFPTHTGATRCLAQPPRGSTTSTSHHHPLIRAPCTTAPAHTSSLVSDHTRVSHAHARPLHPAALAFVPYGIVLVRVRVAQPPRGSTTSTSHQHPLIRAPYTTAPAHTSSLVSDHTRVSHAHARPLHPAALAFVPHGIVLVRVRVRVLRYNRAASGTRVLGCSCRRAKATNTNKTYAKGLGRSVHKRALQPNERACACSLEISHVHPQVAFDLGRARLCLSSGVLQAASEWVRESGGG